MSFNKRFYSWERIIDFINFNNFDSFDKWILEPDGHMFEDDLSSEFFKAYTSVEEELRELLFSCLRDESHDFCSELIKCINVVLNPGNNTMHKDTLESYINLFINKWNIEEKEYKSLIIK